MKKLLYIFLFCIFSNLSLADDNHQKKIDLLFNQLKNPADFEKSKEIEAKIWELWVTHPKEKSLTSLLADGSFYMNQNKLKTAYDTFTKTIELDPSWAEAWNKRATVLYLMGKYELSQNDIDKVLSLEERHFGALSGQGLVQSALKNYQLAIDSYIEAHKIYPAMESPIIMIERLKKLINNETI